MLSCLILSITFRRWWFFFCNGYNLQWKIKTKRTLTYCVSKEENLSYGSWVLLLRYFRLFYDACKDSFTLSQRESTVSFRACQQLFEIELLQNGSLFFYDPSDIHRPLLRFSVRWCLFCTQPFTQSSSVLL